MGERKKKKEKKDSSPAKINQLAHGLNVSSETHKDGE